jgi:hypothetical protein
MKITRILSGVVCFLFAFGAKGETGRTEVSLLNTYTLSALYSDDDSFATQLGANLELGKSRLQLDAGYSQSSQDSFDSDTYRGSITFDRYFEPFGATIGYLYWGDRKNITSHGVRGSIYAEDYSLGRVAFIYERRNIELEFDVPTGARGVVDSSRSTDSNGYGLNLRLNTARADFYAGGMIYDYDVDLTRLGQLINLSRLSPPQRTEFLSRIRTYLFNLSRLNASSLSLASALLDYNITFGVDVPIGEFSFNVELARDVAATDGVTLDSASFGFVHPLADHLEIEYRLGGSKGDDVESSLFGGVTLFWYR